MHAHLAFFLRLSRGTAVLSLLVMVAIGLLSCSHAPSSGFTNPTGLTSSSLTPNGTATPGGAGSGTGTTGGSGGSTGSGGSGTGSGSSG